MSKKNKEDPRIKNDRVGLFLSRNQVKTLGHTTTESQMIMDNSINIGAVGSAQKSGMFDNPLTSDQRVAALKGLWGDLFKIIALHDIGSTDRSGDWADYVFSRIKAAQLPEPTDFYAGSKVEARWYEEHFASLKGEPTYLRGQFAVWENPETGKRIHILDRKVHIPISSSEVRTLIERRDPQWRDFVPQRLWDFYEWEYPANLRAAIDIDAIRMNENYPVGTKGFYGRVNDGVIHILRDDGKWRPRNEDEERAKSLGD